MKALEPGEINLFEAEQLSRLTPGAHRGIPEEERMRKRRLALVRSHLQSGESGARLKALVDALLYHYRDPGTLLNPLLEPLNIRLKYSRRRKSSRLKSRHITRTRTRW